MAARRRRTLWAWDLECVNWSDPICCVAISEDGDVLRFWGPDCLQKMREHIEKIGGTFLAHYGGGYDVPLLMQHSGLRPSRIVLSGSNILAAEVGRKATLRDTYPATLSPLAKLGKWVGMTKGDVDRSHLERHTQAETLDYCEQDCLILLTAIQEQQAYLKELGAKKAWTAGGAAVRILEALEPGTWAMMRAHRTHYEDILRPLAGVRGGRVECWARGRRDKVWSYDFKSSYPARYATSKVGLGVRPATMADRKYGIFRCVWEWPDRRSIPPALDVSQAGAGLCTNWLVGEEIDAFEACGVKVDIREGYAPLRMVAVGHEFAAELYGQKESGSPWAKVFINSLHGKFGEEPIKDSWTTDHPKESYGPTPTRHGDYWSWRELAIDGQGMCPPHAQPVASAQILGRARVALWEILNALHTRGWDVYYCDTDSVHTNCPPHEMPVELGSKLGQLEYESGPCVGYYLGPKAYLLVNATTGDVEKSALKGVPLKNLKKGVRIRRGGQNATDLYRAAETLKEEETAKDLRRELFEDALQNPWGVAVRKEGISSFVRGLKSGPKARWERESLERTISFTGRGKTFEGENNADWKYLTPQESAGRRDIAPEPEPGRPEWMF